MAISKRALRYFRKGTAMRAKTSYFVIFLLLASGLFAAKTTIKGFAPGAGNLKIRLYTYDDYISNREALLASADIDSTGHFTFVLSIYEKQVISGFFRIMDFTSREMYIPANKTYDLEFEPFDYKDPNRIHIPLLSTIQLQYKIKNADVKDINSLISSFNQEYSSFVIQASGINTSTSTYSVKRPPRHLVDSFVNAETAKYNSESNEFFKNYVAYSLAGIQLNFQSKSRTSLFDNYIYKKPILYDNVAYMDFFTSYFSDFIYRVSNHIQPYDIIQNVNMKVNLSGLVDSIGKDTMLRNEQLREAVLLLNIRDWYTSKTFRQDSLLKILDVYAVRTKFDIQGRIARNLKFMLTHFNSGNPAPSMNFVSLDGDVFNNDSLKEKYSYIMFFTTWSKPCLSELLVMNQLMDNWKDSIRFIAVSMDREPLKLFYFLDENKFSFPVYHFGGDWVMAENLGLLSYPHGMFIDKNGNLINYCMPDPSRGVIDVFKKYAGVKTVYDMPDVGH
ncbi:Thiol-disulfide oxidoreductase ResA [bioreactor metagenome]|uniref:Thiol-disulfide oxidoreductase ResA n=1 Tax=bioreactor metagenome TaxID=1076179 RepID=A0A644XRG6_9ZZZZ